MKKILFFIIIFIFSFTQISFGKNIQGAWQNDLSTLMSKNQAIIYIINIRTFNAKDTNGDEIIDNGEESGNFINAIDRLDNLVKSGVNTVHILPVTPVGKIKAFGTAGSLYAITDFTAINPQLASPNSSLSPFEQAKRFIRECHKRNIRVIIDLPSCAGYDLFLEHPEYFLKDNNQNPVIPLDWTDVRLLNVGTDENPDTEILNLHKKFIDMAIKLNVDGIRADVARIKPFKFWQELIQYAKSKDSDLVFLAEASKLWNEPINENAPSLTVEQLFDAGFDSYLGSYQNLKNWKTSKELILTVQDDLKTFSRYKTPKSALASFTTHDEISPVLINGSKFSKMIIWLNATLPLNSYFVDGFDTGDTYSYKWANQKSNFSYTDDEYYFTHNGKLDIFNFSRKPGGKDYTIYEEFVLANNFKTYYATSLSCAKFIPLKTSNPSVFAYARVANNYTIIVFGNLDFSNEQQVIFKIPKLKPYHKIINLRVHQTISNEYLKNKLKTTLLPGDIQVLKINNLVF